MFSTLLAHTNGWDGGPGPWIIFPILWFTLWVGVIVFVVTRFRRGGGPPWARHSGQTVLAERFARGDITADEYRDRREVLRETER
jgi:putative membrane protein